MGSGLARWVFWGLVVLAGIFDCFLILKSHIFVSEIFVGLGDHWADLGIVAFVRFYPGVARRV